METASQVPALVDKDAPNEIAIADTYDYVCKSSYPQYQNDVMPATSSDMMMPDVRRVVQWHPHQGVCDNTLSVTLEQKITSSVPRMKLVFGMQPVETSQQHQVVPSSNLNDDAKMWIILYARVPPQTNIVDAGQVPLSICVYENDRVDQWAFGTFTYQQKQQDQQQDYTGEPGLTDINESYQLLQLLAPYEDPSLKQPDPIEAPPPEPTQATVLLAQMQHQQQQQQLDYQFRQQRYIPTTTPSNSTHYYYTSSSSSDYGTYYSNSNNSPYRSYSQTPPSTSSSPMVIHPFGGVLNKAHLKIGGDLNDMTINWTPQEWHAGRRLVQFTRNTDGETSEGHAQIECSFQPMDQQEHQQQRMRENMAAAAAAAAVAAAAAAGHHHPHPRPANSNSSSSSSLVVSCIYWRERNDYYITSVDCIYLLEGLIGVQFTVEEKNRIRRNLEGFRPLTVSKCKPECADFFKLIMGFPHPKPRNIEKDVKVFAWKTLPHALRKIIRKYTPSYSSTVGISRQQHVMTTAPAPNVMGYLS
ncbi:hypothetical protein BJV82DRAFT_708966 [Fennellomyces sp. T-0311]|nr:hypothetical protein BJV82DRAFT_708966 [Fennellomyces sp. T-0311]